MTLVSVMVPCFNAASYIAAAIDSIRTQRVEPVEIIVVDDGSSDDSAAIAERYGSVVRVIRQGHRGIAAARNVALRNARGDLLAALDADDLWTPGSLFRRLAVLGNDTTIDVVSGRTLEVRADVAGVLQPEGDPRAGRLAGATVMRRAVVDRVGHFDERLASGETLDWIGRADDAGVRFTQIDDVVLHRRLHATNSTRQHDPRGGYLSLLRAAVERRRVASAASDA